MAEPDGRGLGVLIADDDSLVRLVLHTFLHRLGHEVVEASTRDEFTSALTSRAFGLCIMDASMPDSTLEFRLGQFDSLAAGTPLIVVSGYPEPPPAVTARRLPFLSKPVDLTSLTTAISALDVRVPDVDRV